MEIDFNRIQGAPEPGSSHWAVYDLTLEIQYNVYGDGSLLDGGSQPSVVVPSSKSGARFMRTRIVKEGVLAEDVGKSYKA